MPYRHRLTKGNVYSDTDVCEIKSIYMLAIEKLSTNYVMDKKVLDYLAEAVFETYTSAHAWPPMPGAEVQDQVDCSVELFLRSNSHLLSARN